MRLIDADKIVYMWKQDINGDFHDGVTLESIVGKTPTVNVNDLIVEELEKIKEKIDIECDSVDSALDVILDRISELKGD